MPPPRNFSPHISDRPLEHQSQTRHGTGGGGRTIGPYVNSLPLFSRFEGGGGWSGGGGGLGPAEGEGGTRTPTYMA